MSKKYQRVVLGGTFDRLHKGHQTLLNKAFEVAELVLIGLTSESFLKNYKSSARTLSYKERYQQLQDYLVKLSHQADYQIIPIDDMFGTTLVDSEIQAIIVSTETQAGAELINEKRTEIGLAPLEIITVNLVADNVSQTLASTRIRNGLVNRKGQVYKQVFTKTIKISSQQASILKEPMGMLYKDLKDLSFLKDSSYIILVGDQVTSNFIQANLLFTHAITDSVTQRQKTNTLLLPAHLPILSADNPAGQITLEAVSQVEQFLSQKNGWLQINGEEDLLVLPCILLAPLGSSIIYGQPNEGLVVVEVTEETKDKWYNFLKYPDKISA